jgi:hypothetical protein
MVVEWVTVHTRKRGDYVRGRGQGMRGLEKAL